MTKPFNALQSQNFKPQGTRKTKREAREYQFPGRDLIATGSPRSYELKAQGQPLPEFRFPRQHSLQNKEEL